MLGSRENLARLRSLAAEKGLVLHRGVVANTWVMIDPGTGKPLLSDRAASAMPAKNAIKLLSRLTKIE